MSNSLHAHLRTSVGAATALGIALGFWLGRRVAVAGTLEAAAAIVAFVVACVVVMSNIDRQFLKSD